MVLFCELLFYAFLTTFSADAREKFYSIGVSIEKKFRQELWEGVG